MRPQRPETVDEVNGFLKSFMPEEFIDIEDLDHCFRLLYKRDPTGDDEPTLWESVHKAAGL